MDTYESKIVHPDVVLWDWEDSDLLIEVKASNQRFACVLDVGQIEQYRVIAKNGFPYNNVRIYYMFFIHSLDRMIERCRTSRELVEGLSCNVVGCCFVPIEITEVLLKNLVWRKYTCDYFRGRGWREGRDYYIKIYGSVIRRWLNGGFVDYFKSLEVLKFEKGFDFDGLQFYNTVIEGEQVGGFNVEKFPLFAAI